MLKSSFSFNIDSFLLSNDNYSNKNKYLNKLFSNHLFVLSGDDYNVSVSPLVSFSKGIENEENKSTFVNTRGYFVQGMLGKKIFFPHLFVKTKQFFQIICIHILNLIMLSQVKVMRETSKDRI